MEFDRSAELLTVVIAIKNAPAFELAGCVASINSLYHAARIGVCIVGSGGVPELPRSNVARLADLAISEVPPTGVYSAFNHGTSMARGAYVAFLGVDDRFLPPLDAMLSEILQMAEAPDLIAAGVLMEGRGVRWPSRLRSAIVLRNWCQQGILYKRSLFDRVQFDSRYKIQADHKLNIEVLADRRTNVMRSSRVISFFGAGGISSTYHDLAFRKDLPAIAGSAFGWPWGWIVRMKQVAADVAKGKRRLEKRGI